MFQPSSLRSYLTGVSFVKRLWVLILLLSSGFMDFAPVVGRPTACIALQILAAAFAWLSFTGGALGASDVVVKGNLAKGGKFSGAAPKTFTPTKAAATAPAGPVKTYLNDGKSVTITTSSSFSGNGDLTVAAEIAKTRGKPATLTLKADRDLVINNVVRAAKKTLGIELVAGRKITTAAAITSNGANITVNAQETLILGAPMSAGAGQLLIQTGDVTSAEPQTVTASTVDVAPNAALRLGGTVAGNISVSGTISAGAQGASDLQIDGNLSLQPTATTAVNLGGNTVHGRIKAKGAVSLAGALSVDFIKEYEDLILPPNSFTILTAGSLTGEFQGLPNGSRVILPDELGSMKVTYTATSVILNDWKPVLVDLPWDPGVEDVGTLTYTNARQRGRRHFFRIHTETTDIGAWRTRLTPADGEADLYLSLNALPSTTSSRFRSNRAGADGFTLSEQDFAAGQDWFLLVYADTAKPWSVFAGRAYVHDLGTLPWTDTDNSGTYNIGEPVLAHGSGPLIVPGESMRIFKATLPSGTPAWSLWLNGSNKSIAVRKSLAPFHNATNRFDRKQNGQMLLVPPYLSSGVTSYFISVIGEPGDAVNLDSRIQEVTDLPFNTNVADVSAQGPPYRVYRVSVPLEQIAWDVSTVPLAGNPNIAVRRSAVPAEYDNDAFSEAPHPIRDSITLVPDFLTNGAWYITVYGESGYRFSLRNGPPLITPINFTDSKVNDQTERTGWRFYALDDIPSQIGSLGWMLDLAGQVPGTEIALRRNAVPSRWRNRKDGKEAILESSRVEYSSKQGFLERSVHQPDVWYVGIYTPTEALGNFTLASNPIVPPAIAFNNGVQTVTDLAPARWAFVRVDVPENADGWDVRVRNVVGAMPVMAVRHNLLPEIFPPAALANIPAGWGSSRSPNWPTGNQWRGTIDWTGYTQETGGAAAAPGVVAATGLPLEKGTYYVGVLNTSTTTASSFTLESRGIGQGRFYPVTPLAYQGGLSTITDLAPREAQYFKVAIPAGTRSWEVTLSATAGDVELLARYGNIPDFNAASSHSIYKFNPDAVQTEIRKLGDERYVVLPPGGAEFLPEGDYYLAVVSEGVNPTGTTIGTAASSAVLQSHGPLLVTQLGTATPAGVGQAVSLVAGQIKAFQFQVEPGTYSLEIRLLNPVGSPVVTVIPGALLPAPEIPSEAGVYGLDGGILSTSSTALITAPNPSPGIWSVLVNVGPTNDATATLQVTSQGPLPLQFDGGALGVTGHLPGTWRYFTVQVPEGATGWDLRLRDVIGTNPALMVRRDFVPGLADDNKPTFFPIGWQAHTFTEWPSAYQWLAGTDWTGYGAIPARMVAAMGRPLQPGTYYAGVYNTSGSPIAYTIDSRGIGNGLTYPIADLDYNGGTAAVTGLDPREARYFRVSIPAGSKSWEVVLTPSVGEANLVVRRGAVPDFFATQNGSVQEQNAGVELKMKKVGAERYVLLPAKGEDLIPSGDYYLAVVGEGVNPTASVIGAGPVSGQLVSVGSLAIKDLGTASPAGATEVVQLEAGQIKAYQIVVPPDAVGLEVRLDEPAGYPQIALAEGLKPPTPPALGTNSAYGWDSGVHGVSNATKITVVKPNAGVFTVLVRGGQQGQTFGPSTAKLVITELTVVPPEPLNFDGGSLNVNDQQPGTWRYFVVDVPEDVSGWDVRLRNLTGAVPAILVRRDEVPFVAPNSSPANLPSWTPSSSLSWPSGNQWLGGVDWTTALDQVGQTSGPPGLVAAMGHPLNAGTYYVGVFNNKTTPTSYTVDSRGIGAGQSYEINELAFAGGVAQIEALEPREPKYFKVTIPSDTSSWELKLETLVGDLELAIRRDGVPDFSAALAGSLYAGANAPQVKIRKEGAERYLLLPNSGQDVIPAGDYYIAVVSDGTNPNYTSATRVIGTGVSSGVLTSLGPLGITDMGDATIQGISESVTLVSSQTKAYQFNVPAGTKSLEVLLENTVGIPKMAIVAGKRLPVAPTTVSYGGANGGSGGTVTDGLHTVANPTAGLWSVLVRATNTDANFLPDASAKLVIRSKPNIPLNFDLSQNGNGGSHTDTRQAIDDEYNIYQVTPPATLSGQPVLGWILHTEVLQGAVSIAVYKNFANPGSGITIPTGTAVVVPPFLTFDEPWYIRVKATGATQYRITSRPITLERPVWTMPEAHNLTFGDSGTDATGNPLPGDRGVDLQLGFWHFYAIDVPENNQGLLKTELQAISGNPDLYIREDGVPTTSHNTAGSGGASLVHRTLTGANTSYGNWVPLNGRTETRLRPGRWYLGVRAGGNSNVRYRLLASTGLVRELALNPSQATAQVPNQVVEDALADNDWRYYRFTVPATAPKNWRLNFSQQVGDVVMWVRDTVPPGQKTQNTKLATGISDISSDNKNQGPYVNGYDLPDEYLLTTPPLRPGHVYYVGFRSNNSATFSFRSNTGSEVIGIPPAVEFYGGLVETIVPANDSVLYSIPVPADATRFKYTSTHPSTISVRIEQGTLAAVSGTQHFVSSVQNSSANQALSTTVWPWQPGQTYYVRFVNSSSTPQSVTFTLNGKNAQTEDEDNDGLLDAWERQYFTNTNQTPTGDPDGDGSTNAEEFADGTDPSNPASAKYTVTVLAKNGTAQGSPVQVKYARGSTVTLSSTADAGYQFVGWIGGSLRTDDFALKATGTITIPTAGVWTFGIHAGDGARLVINGTTVINDNTTHEPRVTFGQINLAAGRYSLELVTFERTGGESLELFAAPGSFTTMQPTFRLVGDTAGGGLAVETTVDEISTPGFRVRQVASLSSQVTSLTSADTLLASTAATRVEISGVIDTLNFLDYSAYEGHFEDNAFFPLTAGMEDQPLTITVMGNYTFTALHSLPIGVGSDAEALVWRTGGQAPWLAENSATAFDGTDLVASGPIGDNQSALLQTAITGPGTLTFHWKVSSQSGDNLAFRMDAGSPVTITGETTWAQRTVSVPAGTHTFTWTYTKNATGSAGSDRGFIDQVRFVPQ